MTTAELTLAERQTVELQQVRYTWRQRQDWVQVFDCALVSAREAGVSYGRLGGACGMSGQGVRQYMLRHRLDRL